MWGTHEALKQAVRTGGSSFEEIKNTLDTLRTAREDADYVLTLPELQRSYAYKLIGVARWLIRNRIKALPEAEFRRLRVPRG